MNQEKDKCKYCGGKAPDCNDFSTPNQTKEGWEEEIDKLWAKDDEPRLRDFIIPYIHSTILPQERKRVVEEQTERIHKMWNYPCNCRERMSICKHDYSQMDSILTLLSNKLEER